MSLKVAANGWLAPVLFFCLVCLKNILEERDGRGKLGHRHQEVVMVFITEAPSFNSYFSAYYSYYLFYFQFHNHDPALKWLYFTGKIKSKMKKNHISCYYHRYRSISFQVPYNFLRTQCIKLSNNILFCFPII